MWLSYIMLSFREILCDRPFHCKIESGFDKKLIFTCRFHLFIRLRYNVSDAYIHTSYPCEKNECSYAFSRQRIIKKEATIAH